MILFDTTFLIDLVNGDTEAAKLASEMDENQEVAALSAISMHEYLLGVYLVYHGREALREKLESAERDLSKFRILPFTKNIAHTSSKVHAELIKKGTQIGINDTYIGATALNYNIKLVSRNRRHFKQITNLNLRTY